MMPRRLVRILTICTLLACGVARAAAPTLASASTGGPSQTDYASGSNLGAYGVAVADVNNDTHPDIVVTNPGDGNVGVYLNNGDGTYASEVTYSVVAGDTGLAVADLNNDGYPDIVVTASYSSQVYVLLNNKDGTFGTAKPYSVGSQPENVAIGDVTGDGKPDLVVTNYGANTISILSGKGDGTFNAQSTLSTDANPYGVALADLNGDGHPDIAVSNTGGNDINVFLNDSAGSGSFGTPATYSTGPATYSLALGDLNGDTYPDIVAATGNQVGVLLNNKDGTFSGITTYPVGNTPGYVAIGDLTGDGKPDVAVSDSGDQTFTLLQGDGTGALTNTVTLTGGKQPEGVAIADVDNDGVGDVIGASYQAKKFTVYHDPGEPTITSAPPGGFVSGGQASYTITTGGLASRTIGETGTLPSGVTFHDNGDGTATLAGTTSQTGDFPIEITANNGTGTAATQDVTIHVISPELGTASDIGKVDEEGSAMQVADVNGDGIPDVIAAGNAGSTGNVSVMLGKADGTLASPVDYQIPTYPRQVVVSDLNGDHHPDIIAVSFNDSTVTVLMNNGDGTFDSGTNYPVNSASSVAVGDFNGDGKVDLAVADVYDNDVAVMLGNGDGTFRSPTTYSVGSYPEAIAVGDFDGDGNLDIVTANNAGNNGTTVSVLPGNGNGTFGTRTDFKVGLGPTSIVVADFNNDGKPDIATANVGDNTASILLNQSTGTGNFAFATHADYDAGTQPSDIALGDINEDGKPDLVVLSGIYGGSGSPSTVDVMLNNGDGTFSSSFYDGPAPAYSLAVGDLNGDGATDVAVSGYSNSSYSYHIFVLDNLLHPTVSITSSPPSYTNVTQPTFEWSEQGGQEPFTYTCSIDGTAAPCQSPYTAPTPLSDGNHEFVVTGVGSNGLGGSATATWTQETSPPVITFNMTPGNYSGTGVYFTWSVADESDSGPVSVNCRMDGGTWTTCTSNSAFYGSLTDGSHTFEVQAVDQGGTAGTNTYTWNVDATPPTVTLTPSGTATACNSGAYYKPLTVTISATDAGAGVDTVYYSVNYGGWQPYSGGTITLNRTGTISAYAVDKAGNYSNTVSQQYTIVSGTLANGMTGVAGKTMTVNGSNWGKSESMTYSIDGTSVPGTYTSSTSCTLGSKIPVPAIAGGTHTLAASGATSGQTASVHFTVKGSATVSPSSGKIGSSLTVTGAGMPASTAITAHLGSASGQVLGTATNSDASGNVSIPFVVPTHAGGAATVYLTGGGVTLATATFSVSPSASVSPASGPRGTGYTLNGTGYISGDMVTVTWHCGGPSCTGGTTVGVPVTVRSDGTWQVTGVVPDTATPNTGTFIRVVATHGSTTDSTTYLAFHITS